MHGEAPERRASAASILRLALESVSGSPQSAEKETE
jgi:hypothetical protein